MKHSVEELRGIVARVENLDDQIDDLREDRKAVIAEAKAMGFDTKIIGAAVRRRRMLPSERAEFDIMLATYEEALSGWPRGVIDGGELVPLALPAPAPRLSAKDKGLVEALAWAGVSGA